MSKTNIALNKVPIVIKKKSSFTINQHIFQDTIIYDSKEINYFKEKYQRVTLFNRQNILNNSCKLIAKIGTVNGGLLEKTSDGIVKIIGQEQFEVLFMALCSIINQEIRIRGLISILTTNKLEKSDPIAVPIKKTDAWSQTYETRLAKVNVNKRKRMRRQLTPYVVQDFQVPEKIKKVVVDISSFSSSNFGTSNSGTSNFSTSVSNESKEIPDIGYLLDETSNHTNISGISELLKPELSFEVLEDPMMVIKKTVDEHTDKQFSQENISYNGNHKMTNENGLSLETMQQNNFNLILPDNTSIMLPEKPEDHFHIATEENLKLLDINSKIKLIDIQRIIDLKFCMTPIDDEGNRPIHMAVLNEDIHLLKRQCFMLNLKKASVDIEANGLTPLKLSLFKQSISLTKILLSFGADPLCLDNSHSTYFHTAAELDTEHLDVLLQYCKDNARSLISENEELQLPGWEMRSDKELSSYLMDHICSICDSQGYTPLMLATNLGLYNNVRALLTHSPTIVNVVNPTTGNTPLYLAVVAACNVAAERGNKSKLVDNFRKTIELLLDYGADPTIDNYAGSNISVLLTDFQCPELSTLIANRGPASKYNNTGNCNSLMFIKDGDEIKGKDLNSNNKTTMQLKNFRKTKDKPVILESIVLNKSQSDPVVKIESDSIECHTDSNNVLKTDCSDLTEKQTNSTRDHADPIKTYSNVIKFESASIKNDEKSDSDTDSIKTHWTSTKSEINSKLIQFKKPKDILESNDKPIKLSSNNIIVNKPDKIIITPVKLIELDKSNNTKRIDSSNDSVKKIESTVIIESMNKIKTQNVQSKKAIPNISIADFDPNIESNKLPTAIRFLYNPNINSMKRNKILKSHLVLSMQNEKQSISRESSSVVESLAVTKSKPKVYIKKMISSTKKSIKKKIDSNDCDFEVPLKTYKRKLSDSD